ncbi:RNA polymerase sigma-70 factor [Arenibacter sp. F26102]|uniref:RNA polymerase sigma-70 factor n=1 Tax=Arenibacter sp. F26102 TaxID=2926416 RepID=UPI001FF21114|nr:RNA polymerase sigma-70 factor [Arenibacter sp. F26102]
MSRTSGDKTAEKVAALSSGDESAFRWLFDHYHNDILAYSTKLVKQRVQAEEITQDVFVKVWSYREKLNPNLSFKSFLFTITKNFCFNFLKKAAQDRFLAHNVFYESQLSSVSSDNGLAEADLEKLQNGAIAALPPRCRQIYTMSRNHGKSYEEIGSELGISPNTVKNQMSKALSIIRDYLMLHGDIVLLLSILLIIN